MRRLIVGLAGIALIAGAAYGDEETVSKEPVVAVNEDPNIWLEEVEGEAALAWVREQNIRSLDVLQADRRYAGMEAAAAEIVTATDRIPYGVVRDGMVYNFWQDETNVRGLWRRTALANYPNEAPDWETVIDFDALSEAEGANWVYKGANCFRPDGASKTLCMVSLSDGGKDAVIQREFDLETKTWVEDGFVTVEAKQGVSWIDADTVLISTDWGGDGATLTSSGYPATVKRWTRGTPLEAAVHIHTGDVSDVGVWPFAIELEDGRVLGAISEADTFFTSSSYLVDGTEPVRIPVPAKSDLGDVYLGQILVALQEDWEIPEQGAAFKSGDLVSFPIEPFLSDYELPLVELVFRPSARQSFEGVSVAGGTALISINDNVVGKILRLDRRQDGWVTEEVALPGTGQAGLVFAGRKSTTAFINYEGFLTPDSLIAYDTETTELKTLKSAPEKFDAGGLVVEQFETASSDGTKIPYFVVRRDNTVLDGTTPTLLYGYGGFQISLTPSYSPVTGKLWLEAGGAYVLANIRGGGEFGPDWHQAGLKGNRQLIYDDFIAVGEDVIARGITSPETLGIMGGSNGGLLMGVMLNQRPDLWNAVVVQVPLLDMLRYHKLLAGASWIDEYGDPDIPEERAFLETISPYQNFDASADYPVPFFLTSTKDDRVHPGHARKMAKLFEDAGKPFYYYENIDGGHSAAANQLERARRSALEFTYLKRRLMGEEGDEHED